MIGTTLLLLSLTSAGAGLVGQTPRETETLSLPAAVASARAQSPMMLAAAATTDASAARIEQARAALLPRLDFIESATRSDNPVFVFGSLLNQGRFTESNFALDELNQPSPLSLFQSRFLLEQTVFAGGNNWLERRRARLGRDESLETARETEMDVMLRVVRGYYGVLLAARQLEVAEDTLAVGDEDLRSARVSRDAGLTTDADVLALEVRRSELEENRIVAENMVELSWMELNAAMGAPLEARWKLSTPLTPAPNTNTRTSPRSESSSSQVEAGLASEGLVHNPELRRGELHVQSAELAHRQARSAFLPSIFVHAGWESDRASFTGSGGTNWMLGVSLRMNLFNGLGDRARTREAEAELSAARARRAETESRIRQSLRRAFLDIETARERLSVSEGAAARARESHRITRARYESGLASVTELLRSQNALMASELRELQATAETRVAIAELERLTGTLSPSSEAIQP
ncbi:MAG TPA: TolC family protein [Vicinamibacteria bacterium]|nr:TolC family protein [Vicinamibacteria bacterium]